MNKSTNVATSDLIEVNVEILKDGVRITNEQFYKILRWNEITGVNWNFHIKQWSSVLHVRIKKNELNYFFPSSNNKVDLVILRRWIVSNIKRYKKGLDIKELKISGPLKMQTKISF